jgi:glycosyltransferase involved in cell wall biosynthesis
MKNLLVVSPFSVIPPRYGGPLRVYNLCCQLSQYYQIHQFSQQAQRNHFAITLKPLVQSVTSNYVEYSSRNPISLGMYALTGLKLNCPPVWQSKVLQLFSPRWLREKIEWADCIQVEHPWQFDWIYQQVKKTKPIVLASHNWEAGLYTPDQIAAPAFLAHKIVKTIQQQEAFAVAYATHVICVSQEDRKHLTENYKLPLKHITLIPNGVDCEVFKPVNNVLRQQRKYELGLEGKIVVLFSGSMHRPNFEAAEKILQWINHYSDWWKNHSVCFLIVGTVGRFLKDFNHSCIRITGSVESVLAWYEAADIAINPMLSGSGTNLKQLEFMAMALPTIATPVGVRGLNLENEVHAYIRSIETFPETLQWLIEHPDVSRKIQHNSREWVQRHFDWSILAQNLSRVYEKLIQK